MSSYRNRQFYPATSIFSAKAATWNSGVSGSVARGINVSEFVNCVICVSTASSANFTMKVKGAIANNWEDIDFAASATRTNPWTYLQCVNLNDWNPVDGSTGIVYTGTDAVRLYEVNINSIDFLQFEITAYAAGSINVTLTVTSA